MPKTASDVSISVQIPSYVSHILIGMISILVYSLLCLIPVNTNVIWEQRRQVEPLSSAPSDVMTGDKSWTKEAIRKMWEERERMKHTPVFIYKYPGNLNVDIIFKNESASSTGSLKHRYAWALMMWALLEGKVTKETPVFEASSGNTAASLAFMCRLVGVNFTAVVPDTLEAIKQKHIEEYGGRVLKVPIAQRLATAQKEATKNHGFFMNQFGNADKAEEFHESGDYNLESANMMHELLYRLQHDESQVVKTPHYFVHAAGTGGTLSSIGRYSKKYGINTEIVLADTQFSVYFDYVQHGRFRNESGKDLWVEPGIAGIGYGVMGPARQGETTSLDPNVIDRAVKVPDLASVAAMKVQLEQGIGGGTSTGVNFLVALHLAATNQKQIEDRLTIATILADPAKYYKTSYLNREWIAKKFERHGGLEVYDCWYDVIYDCLGSGADPLKEGFEKCSAGDFRRR